MEDNRTRFKKSFWGYRPQDVLIELGRLNQEFEQKIAVQSQTISTLSDEIAGLKQELNRAKEQLAQYQKEEQAVAEVLIRAQLKALQIEADAQEEAKRIVAAAGEEYELKQKQLKHLKEQYDRFQQEFNVLLQRYQGPLGQAGQPSDADQTDNADAVASEAAVSAEHREEVSSLLERFKPRIIGAKI